ncbi:hypothetical protein SPRG_05629 [Saprolegnia parasitica CBS 223.65]|uniref:Homeobox domain-containing protein n=1 Tax=Saprolegnia parasitica (strain CBS 223.65) TaxID=695850 RepID=A0A067CSE0_SAPPC|nr:hypothetical protein SPRG_05629 [Saprolegnia parasitica CBS 223.65]KDO29677.1 hypothetical protein SPRG_05629 [Saprolegnia parasitica CBS 223.65]|eukprot:XP_012199735.1 hypothetical protein SPRG_05629 [Saprolegnia parasitica CBS 223.65]
MDHLRNAMDEPDASQTQMPDDSPTQMPDASQTQMPEEAPSLVMMLQMPLDMSERVSVHGNDEANHDDDVDDDGRVAFPRELAAPAFDAIEGESPVLLDGVLPEAPPGPDFEFAHVLHTNDMVDYSSSSHIRRRGVKARVVPVARYFPLVPPPTYQPPGNATKSIHQQVALRLAFLRNSRPTKSELLELSASTGLPWLEIATWFKGERWRVRRAGGLVSLEGGKPTPNAWALVMDGLALEAPRTIASTTKATIETRTKEKAALRKLLTPAQKALSTAWAMQYADVDDANERAFRVGALVDHMDVRRRKEFRKLLVAEPSLALRADTESKIRKSCADATCTREVVAARADQCWSFMESRFGAANDQGDEKYVDDDGNILLDASLLSGMECMFLRHRDYFMALVHRLKVHDFFQELSDRPHKRARVDGQPEAIPPSEDDDMAPRQVDDMHEEAHNEHVDNPNRATV